MSNITIRPGKVTPQGVAMPEWLSRKDIENGSWQIQEGQALRGEAWTDRKSRIMRVPFGEDNTARIVRAHEMMHAKVSPVSLDFISKLNVGIEAIRAAEEFRVNTLVRVAGFPIDDLRDGSESGAGKRLAEVGDWNNFVLFIAATAGTKSCKDVIRGARSVNTEFGDAGKRIEKAIIKLWKDVVKQCGPISNPNSVITAGKFVGSTQPAWLNAISGKAVCEPNASEERAREIARGQYEVVRSTVGFGFTIQVATLLDSLLKRDDTVEDGEGDKPGDIPSKEELDSVLTTGRTWAPLIFNKNVPLTRNIAGRLGRKRIATNIGVNPRRIDRLLTDPERRIFDRTVKGSGGIVVIDQSGSMRISDSELMELVEAAPGCVVIGYSHKSNSSGVPNAWILADRGKVCSTIPQGNGGNGVDGPILQFAQKLRKKGEPFIWVCDGMVTVSDDHIAPQPLIKWCADFVRKHNIHMVPNVEDGINALRRAANGTRLPTKLVGFLASACATEDDI